MAVLYTDGQSIGNEQRVQARTAKIVFVFQEKDRGPPDLESSRVYFKDIGDKTNNEAEYHALLAALTYIAKNVGAKTVNPKSLKICSDSRLLVEQVNGDWRVEQPRLAQLREKAAKQISELGLRRLVWIPREENYAGQWLEGKWAAKASPITWTYY